MSNYLPIQSKHLTELRKNHGYTQEYIASLIGCTVKTYRSWEKGISVPDTNFLVQLSQVYNVSTDHLLGLIEEKNRDNTFICDITGLSEKAIELVKEEYPSPAALSRRVLNDILSSEEFYNRFCSAACGVLVSIYSIDSFLKSVPVLSASANTLTTDDLLRLDIESKGKLKDLRLSIYEVSRNCNDLIDSIYPTKSMIDAMQAKIEEIEKAIFQLEDE